MLFKYSSFDLYSSVNFDIGNSSDIKGVVNSISFLILFS